MRKARKNTVTRQVIHIVGEGLTELFYFSHLKKMLGYRYSISPRLFENNSIEKIEKKIKELLDEDVFVICVFDADVSRRSDAENKKMVSLKKKYLQAQKWIKHVNWPKHIKVEILIARFIRRLKKLVNRCNKYELMKKKIYMLFWES